MLARVVDAAHHSVGCCRGAERGIDQLDNPIGIAVHTDALCTSSTETTIEFKGSPPNHRVQKVAVDGRGTTVADQAGFDYWLSELRRGLSRGGVVRWVAANDEFINAYPFDAG